MINCFHLSYHYAPIWQFFGHVMQDSLTMILRLIEDLDNDKKSDCCISPLSYFIPTWEICQTHDLLLCVPVWDPPNGFVHLWPYPIFRHGCSGKDTEKRENQYKPFLFYSWVARPGKRLRRPSCISRYPVGIIDFSLDGRDWFASPTSRTRHSKPKPL